VLLNHPPSSWGSPTKRQAPESHEGHGAAHARLRHAIEELILALLAGLLGRRRTRDSVWHPAPRPEPDRAPLPRHRSIHDGTHLVCEHPILWVIGPGPNRGLRPRPRAHPLPRPRIARAPPAAFARPQPL
jgi:hypothetical protein